MVDTYNCRVWDSVTGEWSNVMVVVHPVLNTSEEQIKVLGQSINEAVSRSFDEDRGAWLLMDAHRLNVGDKEVILIQLRALASEDISVIIAVREG